LQHAGARREPLDRRMEQRRLGDEQLARAHHPEHDAIERPVRAADEQQPAEDEDREQPQAADTPADEREHAADCEEEEPRLRDVACRDEAHDALLGVRTAAARAVVVEEAAGRPVLVGLRVAAARAVERGDVLERNEDVAVQLDVGDFVDVAVRREHAFLILASEERDLDLLTFVLACVVLHRSGGQSIGLKVPSSWARPQTAQLSITGSATPDTAAWMRRSEPPWVTTTPRSSG